MAIVFTYLLTETPNLSSQLPLDRQQIIPLVDRVLVVDLEYIIISWHLCVNNLPTVVTRQRLSLMV